ncbi:unnamed protein product [Sphagnum balticum]
MKRGKFVVLEGLDRSGKSTMAAFIAGHLRTQAPTQIIGFPDRTTAIGKMIGDFLANKADINNETVHLLFSANRWESVNKINDILQAGNNIVCDRYWYSGVAYSLAKGMDQRWCMVPDSGLLPPDLVIYLQADP